MKRLFAIATVLTLTACSTTMPPTPTPKQNYANQCLHFDKCDGRPYPKRAYASGVDAKYLSVDEGLGVGGGSVQ